MRPSELLAGVRLVIFDADGTLRRTTVPDQPCPHGPDEWELLPGIRDRLTAIDWQNNSLAVGVASNQDHVGYGLVREDLVQILLHDMIVTATGGAIKNPEIRFCPHRLDVACECRKPAPGMLLDIMRVRRVEPGETLFVGDSHVDEKAARAAGVRFRWAGDFFGWKVAAQSDERSARSV